MVLGLEAVYSGRNGDEEDSGSLTDFFFPGIYKKCENWNYSRNSPYFSLEDS